MSFNKCECSLSENGKICDLCKLSVINLDLAHKAQQPEIIQMLYSKSKLDIVNQFVVERDAKNKAYYFIIENKLMHRFEDYFYNRKKGTEPEI